MFDFPRTFARLTAAAALSAAALLPAAQALPPLPAAELADRAVHNALAGSLPYTAPVTMTPAASGSDVVLGRAGSRGRTAVLKSTAYNSLSSQTDSTPHITATGTRTRPGVVALSRDMLRMFPYGTRVRIEPLNGYHPYVNGRIFIVEDTMHARKTNQVDIWMPTRSQAMQWGVRSVRITAVQ